MLRWSAPGCTPCSQTILPHAHGMGILIILLFLVCSPEMSQAQCAGISTPLIPFAEETLTVSSTVKSLTSAVYQPAGTTASMAIITVEGGDLRYFLVNTPTSGFGHHITATPPQSFPVCGRASIQGFKAIRITGDATITITYYKQSP